MVGIWSEKVGILEVIKNKFCFVYLRFSDFFDIFDWSDMSELVGIGRNPWSEMSVHLWGGGPLSDVLSNVVQWHSQGGIFYVKSDLTLSPSPLEMCPLLN